MPAYVTHIAILALAAWTGLLVGVLYMALCGLAASMRHCTLPKNLACETIFALALRSFAYAVFNVVCTAYRGYAFSLRLRTMIPVYAASIAIHAPAICPHASGVWNAAVGRQTLAKCLRSFPMNLTSETISALALETRLLGRIFNVACSRSTMASHSVSVPLYVALVAILASAALPCASGVKDVAGGGQTFARCLRTFPTNLTTETISALALEPRLPV